MNKNLGNLMERIREKTLERNSERALTEPMPVWMLQAIIKELRAKLGYQKSRK